MQPSSAVAERVDAALVAPFDHATEPAGDGALGGVDPEQAPGLPGDHADIGVAAQEAGHGVGDDVAEVELARSEGAVGVDVVVEDDLAALAATAGALERLVEGIGAPRGRGARRRRPR